MSRSHDWQLLKAGQIPRHENLKFCRRCGIMRLLRASKVIVFEPLKNGFRQMRPSLVAEPDDLAADILDGCPVPAPTLNLEMLERLARYHLDKFYGEIPSAQ